MASRIVLAVPALLLSLALAGCNNDAPATTSPNEPASVAASSDTPSAGNRTDRCVDDFDRGTDYFPDEVEFIEAAGVEVTYEDNYKVVRVKRPWVGAKQPLTYVLVQCGTPAPKLDEKVTGVIEVPVRRIVSMSTTNLPALEMLESLDRLVGVGTAAYVYSPEVRRLLEKGDVVETGENAQADLERLVELDPDLVLTYSLGDPASEGISAMTDAGIAVALNGEYTEQTPLARAEWLKFVALFTNQEAAAEDAFSRIATDYRATQELAADVEERPRVFLSTPFEGTWYMPRGDSANAVLIEHAGAEYAFAGAGGAAGTGNLTLDIEAVLDRAGDAEFWLNTGALAEDLRGLAAVDERFREFEAFRNGDVYTEFKRTAPGGGNTSDYYETGYARPDLVLADLVAIFHPDLLPDHELVFYERLPRRAPANGGGTGTG